LQFVQFVQFVQQMRQQRPRMSSAVRVCPPAEAFPVYSTTAQGAPVSDPAAGHRQLASRPAAHMYQSRHGLAMTGCNERQTVLHLQGNEAGWAAAREDHALDPLWLRSRVAGVLDIYPVRREQVRRRAATGDIEQTAYFSLTDVRIMPRSPA